MGIDLNDGKAGIQRGKEDCQGRQQEHAEHLSIPIFLTSEPRELSVWLAYDRAYSLESGRELGTLRYLMVAYDRAYSLESGIEC